MRLISLAFLMLMVVGGLSLAQLGQKQVPAAEAPAQNGLAVHEWGVFRLHDSVDFANADMKQEWNGLPRFVYGQVPGRDLPQQQSNIMVLKPVIYLHSSQACSIDLRVDFPGGMPTVWWPRTTTPAVNDGVVTEGAKKGEPFRFLQWNFQIIKTAPVKESLRPVSDKHWMNRLRAVKADTVSMQNPPSTRDNGLQAEGFEQEKFIYYDGMPAKFRGIEMRVTKDKITVANPGSFDAFDVTIVDRRQKDDFRVARLSKLDHGTKDRPIEFVEAKANGWPDKEAKVLLEQLKDAGLFEDEAQSLVDVWKQEFFQAEGLTLFYRIPQEQYERILPLTMKPKPEKLIRVGLVHRPYYDPALAEKVAGLVNDLNDDDYQKREQAQESLVQLGRSAYAHLKFHRNKTTAPENKRRLDQILEKYDATEAMRP